MKFRSKLVFGVSGLALAAGLTVHDAPAMAQGQTAQLGIEEIVVTARKREESLREIPLAITAFSAADIDARGFRGLEDITLVTPGVQYHNQGGQAPGRYTSAIRFRGMNVNSASPSLQLGSLFIDGVYVLGSTQSIPLYDVERVEVIKGPQSAYFGRNTFGGAVNYITRNPSTTEFSGKISAYAATYDEFDMSASVEGPLVEDKLGFSVGARFYSKGAMYTATDGGGLGEESSTAVSGVLYATPTDSFSFKLRGYYNKDNDGPPAGGLVQGTRNNTCAGKTIQTQDPNTPTASPNNYVCGKVPEAGDAISALGTARIIDSNTSLLPQQAARINNPNVLINNLLNKAQRPEVNVPSVDRIGMERETIRVTAIAAYDFSNGYSADVQGGYNRMRANWLRDFGITALENWWSRDPQDAKDYSVEARISSPQDQRLTWLAGANYYYQKYITAGSGGDAVSLCTFLAGGPTAAQPCPASAFISNNNLLQDTDKIKAWGIFGSVSYDITEQLTVNLEGRYQNNEAQTAILTTSPLQKTDKNFLPRAILRYQPTDETNLYASYAKGVIQGQPNAQVASATPRELAQYQAQIPSAAAELPAEILDMFEVGWKQSVMENRAFFNVAAYYGEWKNQKGRGLVVLQEDCGSPSHGLGGGCVGGNPAGIGQPGQPATNPDGTPFLNSRNVNAPGTSELWGIEVEGAVALTENWDAAGNITYARSKYKDFLFNFVAPIAGFSQMKGNSNARFPDWSGAVTSTYTDTLSGDWNWFVSGDLIYFGKAYADESNLAYCDGYWLANTRMGAEREDLRVEFFVRNLFNDKNWAACSRWTDFDAAPSLALLTSRQGIAVTGQNKRQFGIRSSINF